MTYHFEYLSIFIKAVSEENYYLIPILLGIALLAYLFDSNKKDIPSCWKLFSIFVAVCIVWRLFYTCSMRGGSRYNQVPVVLLSSICVAGIAEFYQFVKGKRFGIFLTAFFVVVISGMAIGKALKAPKQKTFIGEFVKILQGKEAGIILDCSDGRTRFYALLPHCVFIDGEKGGCTQPRFWNVFNDFIQKQQGKETTLYIFHQEKIEEKDTIFHDSCTREWGFCPFHEIARVEERGLRYQIEEYVPPSELFGLPCITKNCCNPFGLQLPDTIEISNKEKFQLNFDSILKDNPFSQWGGIELRAPYGKCFDRYWEFDPAESTETEFPFSVTLFLPNGWPVGYAVSNIRLVDKKSSDMPLIAEKHSEIDYSKTPPRWNLILPENKTILNVEEDTALLWNQMANLPGIDVPQQKVSVLNTPPGCLEGNVFWIGSRCNGTKWLTDQLQKRNPKLEIKRLEAHPLLSYSGDPRYTFEDLTTSLHDPNPLLKMGKIDWNNYCAQNNIAKESIIVLALGYEEVQFLGWQKAFHIDSALKSLQLFLDNVCSSAHDAKILLIAPNLPSDRDSAWAGLSSNPYIYGFRWNKRHCYQRLMEGLSVIEQKYSQVTLLPSYLFVPAGEDECSKKYLPAVERYLYFIQQK